VRIMIETTRWDFDADINHVYVFDDKMDHIIAYVPAGTRRVQKFRRPIAIDRRGRTFEALENTDTDTTITVLGSKGQKYLVDRINKTCTCPGFTFRGQCKHIENDGK
jgi:hypothetical protein